MIRSNSLILYLEQFAHREGDQRQLVQRREVVLLRRTQNGEMHQIDGRIGLQQPPPGALARMRLARDQQHAQPVAHAVDLDDRPVVDLETSPGSGSAGISSTVGPARVIGTSMAARGRSARFRSGAARRRGGWSAGRRRVADAARRDPRSRRARSRTCRRCRSRAPRSPAGGGRFPRPSPGSARCSGAPPGAVSGMSWICPSVIATTPASRDARNVGQRAVDRREQPRAGIAAFRHRDRAQLQIGQLRRLLPRSRAAGGLGQARAVADLHARRSGRPPAGRHRAASRGSPAPDAGRPAKAAARRRRRAARPCPRARRQSREREHQAHRSAEQRDQPDGKQRVEADARRSPVRDACYCPSRSRIAGTCT